MTHIYFVLKTADADRLWDYGPGYVRLAAWAVDDGKVKVSTDPTPLVELLSQPGVVAVGHNILAFDLRALELYHGLNMEQLVVEDRAIDTLVLARQADPAVSGMTARNSHALDTLTKTLFSDEKLVTEDGSALEALARTHGGLDQIPTDDATYRRCVVQDVKLVRRLAGLLRIDTYTVREHRVLHRLGAISGVGTRVDVSLVERMIAIGKQVRVERLSWLHDKYGVPLAGKAPHRTAAGAQAIERAFEAVNVTPPRTAKGRLATDKDSLNFVLATHSGNTELALLVEALRELNGVRSVPETVMRCVRTDGRIHPGVDGGQASGRFSVTEPGMTVFSKRDRANIVERALLVPDDGNIFLCADLSGVDARAMAALSQDPEYIAAMAPGRDIHDEIAFRVFGECNWDRATSHHPRRKDAKAITHGTSYGMGARRLAAGTGMSVAEAEEVLASMKRAFPELESYKNRVRQMTLLRNPWGRTLRVAPANSYTQAPALMGQGTARDIFTEGILRMPSWLAGGLRAVIHDEVLVEVPAERADAAREALLRALQFNLTLGSLTVQILAEVSPAGRDWLDCYRDDLPWPETAWEHRQSTTATCNDRECTWHHGTHPLGV